MKNFSNSWTEKHTFHEPVFAMGFDITNSYFDFGISISHIDMFAIHINTERKQLYISLVGFNFRFYFGK